MPKPKRLSGRDVVKIFELFGFEQISQRGSHAKLRRPLADGSKQTLTVPTHPELDKGTLMQSTGKLFDTWKRANCARTFTRTENLWVYDEKDFASEQTPRLCVGLPGETMRQTDLFSRNSGC